MAFLGRGNSGLSVNFPFFSSTSDFSPLRLHSPLSLPPSVSLGSPSPFLSSSFTSGRALLPSFLSLCFSPFLFSLSPCHRGVSLLREMLLPRSGRREGPGPPPKWCRRSRTGSPRWGRAPGSSPEEADASSACSRSGDCCRGVPFSRVGAVGEGGAKPPPK